MYFFIVGRNRNGGDVRVGQTRRRDQNERSLVRDLRKMGYHVTPVSGDGAPDLIIRRSRRSGFAFGCEVKTAAGTRTTAQQQSEWPIVQSLDDVLRLMGGL